MIIFLGAFAALGLLALIVYALHKFQQKEKEESVDRNSPLPPLPSHQLLEDSEPRHRNAPEDKDWQQLVKDLKESGQIRQALDVCRSGFPQMGAFKQAGVLLRAEVREAKRMGKNAEKSLAELYKVCAMAALFHEKIPGMPALSTGSLKRVEYAEFDRLAMPYKTLGHAHLKLLSTTDRKMLEDVWGVPDSHLHVREFHKDAWQTMLTHLQ